MSGKSVINKGNYSLETPQREAEFERRRGAGWEASYAAYRNAWNTRPALGKYGSWPLLVDMELSSACNLQCPMCYTITEEFKRHVSRQYMPMDLFCRVIDEIAPHVPALRLSFRGEPCLHPHFLECVAYAKQKGVGEVSFLTNAGKWDEAFICGMVEAGADWITVSVDGLHDVYEGIRKPLRFEDTVAKLRAVHEVREALGKARPVVKVQSIWPAIAKNPSVFYNFFAPLVDFVAFNPLIDYLGKDEVHALAFEDDFRCPMLYQRLVITSDGHVLPCSNDSRGDLTLGSVEGNSIHEIWNGEALRRFRAAHACKNGFRNFETCLHCYLPRATQEEAHELTDGRTLIVRNYLNRSQFIGQ